MICISINEVNAEGAIAALKDIEFAEVRLDKMNVGEEEVKKIFSLPAKRIIATCRPNGRSESERKILLIAAINAGAAYVDVEADAEDRYKKEIVDAAKAKKCKVIISYHNYEKTPPGRELGKMVKQCFASGADIAKIACKVNSDADSARLLGLLDTDKKLIVIGMGKKGKITRIVAPLLGSEFTFASLANGKGTAEGQMEKGKMERMMGELENV